MPGQKMRHCEQDVERQPREFHAELAPLKQELIAFKHHANAVHRDLADQIGSQGRVLRDRF